MKKRRLIFVIILIALPLFGCHRDYRYRPGGPYYYTADIASYQDYDRSGLVNYQPFEPHGEITKDKAEQLSNEGDAYHIAYFNSHGRPTLIEKHYRGKIDRKIELFYKNDSLFKVITTNPDGTENVTHYNE